MAQMTCTVDGCDSRAIARGWCVKHYQRWQRTGSPTKTVMAERGSGLALLRAAAALPNTDVDPCVLWPEEWAHTSDGYGSVLFNGQIRAASAVACELRYGPRPQGMEARHGPCHNRRCVLHIQWGTQVENQRDRRRDGTVSRGRQPGR